MKKILIISTILFNTYLGFSQVGIGTQNPQNFFHIDGQKNNPISGTPTTAQQADDFIVTDQGRVGVGINNPFSQLSNSATNAATDNSGRGINQNTGINWNTSGAAYSMILNNSDTSGTGSGLFIKTNSTDPLSRPLHVMSGTANVLSATGNARVGVGIEQPSEKLDIAGGNVRIRDINTNNGNRTTDSRVVADANGVLKTVANQTANLVGNTFTDNVPETDWITVNQTNSNIGSSINTYTFTITQTSLVIMNYSVSFALQAPIELDGRLKRVTNSMMFTNAPLESNVVLNKSFAFQTHGLSSSAIGLPGQYFNAAGESMVLTPGIYTVSLNGGVAVTNVVNNSLAVKFGLGNNDSFTINAIAL